MKMYASIWRDYTENSLTFYGNFDVTRTVRFGTQAAGGFASCAFSVTTHLDRAQKLVQLYLGTHVVIFDYLARRVWEGTVTSTGLNELGLEVSASGYYAKAKNYIFDMIYLYVEPTINLCDNPSFENNVTDGWTLVPATGGTVVRDTSNHSHGVASAKFTQPTAGTAKFYFTEFGVAPLVDYTVSLDAKKLDIEVDPILYIEEWTNPPGGTPTKTTELKLGDLSDTSFSRYEKSIITLADTATLKVGVSVAPKAAPKSFYIDGVQLEQKPYSTAYCDGSLGWLHSWAGAAHNSNSLRAEYSPTIYEIVHDGIDMVSEWNPLYAMVVGADFLVGTQDFTNRRVNDAIEAMLKYGYSETNLVPVYFAIWENRIPYLYPEPQASSGYPDWLVSTASITGGKRGVTMSLDQVYNRVYAVYDDQGFGQSKTLPANDSMSQNRYGIIEGMVQNGESPEGIALANDLRDMALAKFKQPRQIYSIELSGLVRHGSGRLDYPYRIRSGQQILIVDSDIATAHMGTLSGQSTNGLSGFVVKTEYNSDSHTMRIDFGSADTSFELLMSRLGLSGGMS